MIKLLGRRVVWAVQRWAADSRCCCCHPRDAHEHYRAGSECALCGAEICSSYRQIHGPVSRFIPFYGVWRCGRSWTLSVKLG